MPSPKLLDVIKLAYNNPKFLDALLTDVDRALADSGLKLTPGELKKLKKMMDQPLEVTGRQVLTLLSDINAKEVDKTVGEPGPIPPW